MSSHPLDETLETIFDELTEARLLLVQAEARLIKHLETRRHARWDTVNSQAAPPSDPPGTENPPRAKARAKACVEFKEPAIASDWGASRTDHVKYYIVTVAPKHPDCRYNFNYLRGIHQCDWNALQRKFHGKNPNAGGRCTAEKTWQKAEDLWYRATRAQVEPPFFEGCDDISVARRAGGVR
jgi:hypothetical protein